MLISKKIITLFSLFASISSITAVSTAVIYKNYVNDKTPSNEQFDFDSNDIADSEITLDGILDSTYGSNPCLDFGPSVNGNRCVKLYTYHGKEALYFYFDVADLHVNKRAIGDNNAQDEDGVEISIDRLIDGGSNAQLDDLRIYLGVSGYSKVIKGTGSGWDTTTMIGFGGSLAVNIKEGTTVNFNSDVDTGYSLEYRIPYISIFGDANKKTPLAMAFVHSGLEEVSGTRVRTGMSGHPTFKISTADNPNNFIILSGNEKFYTKKEFNNINENLPTVLGRVVNKNGNLVNNANVEGYYSEFPERKYSTKTNSSGYFNFDNINVEDDFIVTVYRSDYISSTLTYTKDNLKYANGAEYCQDYVLLPLNSSTKQVKGQISALVNDDLSNFKVELLGHPNMSVLTDNEGKYTIDVYSDIDNTLLISKNNFETASIFVSANETSLAKQEIYHKTANIVKPGYINLSTNKAIVGLSKAREGIYVKALTYYPLEGQEFLSVYFNTGEESYFYNNFYEGDYLLKLSKNNAQIAQFDENRNEFVINDVHSNLINYSTHLDLLYQTDILIPYECLDLENTTEVFGAAATFFDGEEYQESVIDKTIAKDGEIDYLSTATYLRFADNGLVYFANSNNETSFLYYYHGVDGADDEAIPTNADRIYADYVRNEQGVQFNIAVDNGFSTHFNPKFLSGIEGINLVLNLDGIDLTAWALYKTNNTCYDANLRIYSDDTICYVNSQDLSGQSTNQLWWSDHKHNNGVAKNFTLTSHIIDHEKYEIEEKPGYKIYHLNFTYEDLLTIGGAPNNVVLDKTSPISMGIFEISETSRTTVRFYTSSGDSWIYKNRVLQSKTINYSSQSTYCSLEAK